MRGYSQVVRQLKRVAFALSMLQMGCTQHVIVGGRDAEPIGSPTTVQNDAQIPIPLDSATPCRSQGCDDAGQVTPTCNASAHALHWRSRNLLLAIDSDVTLTQPWQALHDGVVNWLNAPSSAGWRVGLVNFQEACDITSSAAPDVPFVQLPEQVADLIAPLPTIASGVKSFMPNLRRALNYAETWSSQNADAPVQLLFLTDGSAGPCDGAIVELIPEAQVLLDAKRLASRHLEVYFVNFGSLQTPDTLATLAGTEAVSMGPAPTADDVHAALQGMLAQSTSACRLTLTDGQVLDATSQANVQVQSDAASGMGGVTSYEVLADADLCQADHGFYHEAADAADTLMACPQTCATLHQATSLQLSGTCNEP